jgi:NTP pyrophosphatase (non-canonical NTP hydrolase)
MNIREFQDLIARIYGDKDIARGTAGTFMWFSEEVGELSRALRRGQRAELEHEFADVLAWLSTLASMHGVDLGAAAAAKYRGGCPRCSAAPCACEEPTAGHGPARGPGAAKAPPDSGATPG